jgi:hypothetical protein
MKLQHLWHTPCAWLSSLTTSPLSLWKGLKHLLSFVDALLQILPSPGCSKNLGFSNTSNRFSFVHAQTISMPSWKSISECSVTLNCALFHTVFLSKVLNHLEISPLVCEFIGWSLLAASLLTPLRSDTQSLHRLIEFPLSVVHSLHLA